MYKEVADVRTHLLIYAGDRVCSLLSLHELVVELAGRGNA